MKSLNEAWQWQAEDHLLHTLPLHHIHGLVNGLMCAHYACASVQFAPFNAQHVWRSFIRHEASVFMGVPTMYSHLLRVYDKMPAEQQAACRAAAAELRLTVCGSSACPTSVMRDWQALSGSVWSSPPPVRQVLLAHIRSEWHSKQLCTSLCASADFSDSVD
jgi:malonyl-CoA/methylmalonyl-CoA synthetase